MDGAGRHMKGISGLEGFPIAVTEDLHLTDGNMDDFRHIMIVWQDCSPDPDLFTEHGTYENAKAVRFGGVDYLTMKELDMLRNGSPGDLLLGLDRGSCGFVHKSVLSKYRLPQC